MHSVACQLLKKKVHIEILQYDSLLAMRNDFDFWNNICQVKYGVFRNLAQNNFFVFSGHVYTLLG